MPTEYNPLHPLPDYAYDTKEVAQIFKCSAKRLEADRVYGRGIPYVKIGGLVRYLGQDLISAFKSGRVVPGQSG